MWLPLPKRKHQSRKNLSDAAVGDQQETDQVVRANTHSAKANIESKTIQRRVAAVRCSCFSAGRPNPQRFRESRLAAAKIWAAAGTNAARHPAAPTSPKTQGA